MFTTDTIEDKIRRNENQIKELAVQIETLNRQELTLLEELKVTPEQLTQFVGEKENFTEKNWEELQSKREELDSKMACEINNIRNLKKTSTSFKNLQVNNAWLYVK